MECTATGAATQTILYPNYVVTQIRDCGTALGPVTALSVADPYMTYDAVTTS